MTKPNAFIGSSREAVDLASAIHSLISYHAQVTPWYAGAFEVNQYTMESLELQLDQNDFGIFVFAPDDVALHRGKYVFITRDNTLFEMGLFWGRLRRKRVFAIIPNEVKERDDLIKDETVREYHLLSDLQGLTLLKYERRSDGRDEAAVSVACRQIIKVIQAEGRYLDPRNKLREMELEIQRKRRVLHFFMSYVKNVSMVDGKERYDSLSDAIKMSIIAPHEFIVTGVAIWKVQGTDGIEQVGGHVGKGRFFTFQENHIRMELKQQPIFVLDAYLSGKWIFFNREEFEIVVILCYPLDKDHVLSVHFSGDYALEGDRLNEIVNNNSELFRYLIQIVGGESK
ncbi:TIR domain-containing protein [Paenibacillus stellifer]|uniref:TIR domain-containing protein n=1 Tax=Paenibacillus stellifer TaxID=169760 RepID=UPI000A871115|nr:TIR domain-containing protein [Paenibacillus stellifer]